MGGNNKKSAISAKLMTMAVSRPMPAFNSKAESDRTMKPTTKTISILDSQ